MIKTLNMFQIYLDKDYYDFNRKISIINLKKKITIIPVYHTIKKQFSYYLNYFNTTLVLRFSNLGKIIRNFSLIKPLFLNNYIMYNEEGTIKKKMFG